MQLSRITLSTFTKPIYIFTLANLMISLIFTSLLLAGCSSPTAGIRKFYLLSLRYKSDHARIGYGGICIASRSGANTTDENWNCGGRTSIVSYSLPLGAATVTLVVTALLVIVNCIPAITVPAITRTIAGATASLGMLLLLGCMILQHVTSKFVNLVAQLSAGAFESKIGYANVAFGWSAFACAVLAAVALVAVAQAEATVAKAEQATDKAQGAEPPRTRDECLRARLAGDRVREAGASDRFVRQVVYGAADIVAGIHERGHRKQGL
jgi:hypothetical protein